MYLPGIYGANHRLLGRGRLVASEQTARLSTAAATPLAQGAPLHTHCRLSRMIPVLPPKESMVSYTEDRGLAPRLADPLYINQYDEAGRDLDAPKEIGLL